MSRRRCDAFAGEMVGASRGGGRTSRALPLRRGGWLLDDLALRVYPVDVDIQHDERCGNALSVSPVQRRVRQGNPYAAAVLVRREHCCRRVEGVCDVVFTLRTAEGLAVTTARCDRLLVSPFASMRSVVAEPSETATMSSPR